MLRTYSELLVIIPLSQFYNKINIFFYFFKFLFQLSYDPLNELKSVLKVVVPDETNGSLLTKTLPVRPHMTTRDVCKIIAHKLRITNPQDYSLFKLIDGQGIKLLMTIFILLFCPWIMSLCHCIFRIFTLRDRLPARHQKFHFGQWRSLFVCVQTNRC